MTRQRLKLPPGSHSYRSAPTAYLFHRHSEEQRSGVMAKGQLGKSDFQKPGKRYRRKVRCMELDVQGGEMEALERR